MRLSKSSNIKNHDNIMHKTLRLGSLNIKCCDNDVTESLAPVPVHTTVYCKI